MNKVTKVSIGGIAFTLDEDAYILVSEYLDKLNAHYSTNANGKEILEGIEERMAELFIDRGGKTGIISTSIAQEVIGIMGRPEEIFGEPDNSTPEVKDVKKRFYRNPGDKIIGGVLGGIGAYFKIDPVWLRVGMAGLLVLSAFTDKGWWNPGMIALAYAVLWICIPMARTTEQKCAMRGESLSYGDPEKHWENRKEYDEANNTGTRFWSLVGKCLLIIPGIFLLIIGLAGFIGMLAALFGLTVAGLAIPTFISGILGSSVISLSYLWVPKLLIGLVVVLPFVGMLYGGIMLIFKLKAPAWRPGLILFVIWLLSLIGLILFGIKTTKNYWHLNKNTATELIVPAGKSLYVEFEGLDRWENKQKIIKGDRDQYILVYVDTEGADSASVVVYPFVEMEHVTGEDCTVNVSSNLFNSTMSLDELNKTRELSFYRFHGDTLTLSPAIYGKGNPVKEIGRKIKVNIPDDMNLVIERPVFHQFDNEFEYSNMSISPERIEELEKITDKFNVDINFDDFLNK